MSRLLVLVAMMLSSLLAPAASAAPYAVVEAISEPDAAGLWRGVEQSAQALSVRDGQERTLAVGDALQARDALHTSRARVHVRLADGDALTVFEDSQVVLEDWGVLQELGEVLYRVRGRFRVQYSSAEALVEGTRFLVSGRDGSTGRVEVQDGVVRVRSPEGELLLQSGQAAAIAPGQAPALELASATRPRDLPGGDGLPPSPVELGVVLGFGPADQPSALLRLGHPNGAITRLQVAPEGRPSLRLDVTGRVVLPGPLGLVGGVGLMNTDLTSHVPITFGPQVASGPLRLALQGELALGTWEHCPPGAAVDSSTTGLAMAAGGRAVLGLAMPLPGRWQAQGQLAAGWTGGSYVNASVGVARRLRAR